MISDDSEILPSQEIMIRIPRFDDTLIILGIFVINNFIATELQIIISIFAVEKKKELAIKPVSRENKVNSRKDI